MKKIISIIVMLSLFCVMLASCGGKTPQTDSLSNENVTNSSADESTQKQPTELTVSSDDEFLGELQDDYGSYSESGVFTIYEYTGQAQIINIPDALDGQAVLAIKSGAFGNVKIFSVRLPAGLTVLRSKMFLNQSNLETAVLNEGLNVIEEKAFFGCSALKNIELPESLQTIGKAAFCGCETLENVILPDSLTEIGKTAFAQTKIKTITIPAGIERLEDLVFQDCTELTDVYFENPDTEIDVLAFESAPNVVLHAAAGSAVEQFAAEKELPFVAG